MDWADIQGWCRLCGSLSGAVSAEGELATLVAEMLHIEIPEKMLCFDCTSYLHELIAFKSRSIGIQEMFRELENIESSPEHLNLIRSTYGLEQGGLEIYTTAEDEIVEEETITDVKQESDEEEFEFLEDEEPEPEQYARKPIHKTESEKLYEFKCHICSLEFPKFHLLSVHCHSHSPPALPQVLCPWCGVTLSSWKRCMAHKAKHIKEAADFICRICNVSYKKQVSFDKHNASKHGPDAVRFICSQCGKEFKERNILKNHEKTHLPDELKLKHPCTFCGKKFVNGHCLKIHIARVHDKVALHTCELCGKGCITKSDLKWHMDKHVEERNYECEICHLKFKSTNSLRIHKRRHFNQDKKIVCPICEKEFFSSAALSNHKLVHSEVKRYKCFCGNEYKRLESYKCHVNSTHTGERPFSCMWCSRTFVNSANCRKHKLKDHPQEVAEYEAVHGKKGVSLAMKTQPN